MPETNKHQKGLVDLKGHPLKPASSLRGRIKSLRSTLTWTGFAAWVSFFYVIAMGADSLVSLWQRRFSKPQDVTISEFEYSPRVRDFDEWYPPQEPARTAESDTDLIDLKFKLINHSTQTILVKRVEVDFVAKGSVPDGGFETSVMEISGRYVIKVPDLQPDQNATVYVDVPHKLGPNEADAFEVVLIWPDAVAITGEYIVQPRLVTSVGVQELRKFSVPVISDAVPIKEEPTRRTQEPFEARGANHHSGTSLVAG